MDERIDPIDWEEVPFDAELFDSKELIADRRIKFHPYECVSQPDMLTKNQIYVRRILLAFAFLGVCLHLEKKYYFYNRYYIMRAYYYNNWWSKLLFVPWVYYITCKQFIDRHSQTTYN
jgi:hypothetical protein